MDTMSLRQATRSSLASYATFTGRARRSEYWGFSVVYVAAAATIAAASIALHAPLLGLVLLPLIVPMLAVSVRRLHDTGRSGWNMLIAIIPIVGPIAYLRTMTFQGAPTENRYGPPPKAADGATT